MGKISYFLLLDVLLSISVEGFFFVTPKPKTCVIVGRAVSLECGTYNEGYTLTFVYVAPPGHSVSSPPIFSEDLPGGGQKINTTFIVTKELNTTTVRCLAVGSTYVQTNPEVMYSYEIPDGTRNNKVCQLADYIFVTWDPIFALPGIGLTFRINDNVGSNYVTSDHHSFSYTVKNYSDYNASVTVIVNATAANQIGYSNSTNISKTLNGTIPLTVGYHCDNNEGNWAFDFHTKLDHLNINECFINNETLKDAMIVSCNEEQCVNNSGNVTISKNEIISTNSLPAKRKYNHTLCFNYLGRLIISQPLETSTHDVQDIKYLSQNDTPLCLRFHLISHYQIQSIHMNVKRGSELLSFNVMVPNNNNIFEWCASTIPATSSNNGNWSLFACDGPGHNCTNPAVVLENIMLNINTATTHNTIATTYTTHTTPLSQALHSTSISSSSSPSPSSTETATLPSSTVNLIVPVIAVVVTVLIAMVSVIIIIIVMRAQFRKKKTKATESNVMKNEPA